VPTAQDASLNELHSLTGGYFKASSVLHSAASTLQLAAILVASLPGLRDPLGLWAPVLVAAFAYLIALGRLGGDRLKASGDRVLRHAELLDGFGIAPSVRELADLEAEAPWFVDFLRDRPTQAEGYFASNAPPSPGRVIQNTYESAWWTQRLSHSLAVIELIRLGVFLVVGLLVLRIAITPDISTSLKPDIALLAVSLIMFLLTQGPLRRTTESYQLSAGCRTVVSACEAALQRQTPMDVDAFKVLFAYQLARKGSPPIPRWLWKAKRKNLNRLWAPVAASLPHSGSIDGVDN
jgi:hypothetical protein